MPKKVTIGDITVRDGFQPEEKFIFTAAKIYYLEELIFAGCRTIEVTNLGNPQLMPRFRYADISLAHLSMAGTLIGCLSWVRNSSAQKRS